MMVMLEMMDLFPDGMGCGWRFDWLIDDKMCDVSSLFYDYYSRFYDYVARAR